MRPSVGVGELTLAFAGISASALRRSGGPLRLLASLSERERERKSGTGRLVWPASRVAFARSKPFEAASESLSPLGFRGVPLSPVPRFGTYAPAQLVANRIHAFCGKKAVKVSRNGPLRTGNRLKRA